MECKENDFLDTKQGTILFIVKNEKGKNENYTMKFDNILIFSTKQNIKRMRKMLKKSKCLKNLDCKVSIGNIVWNQCKKELTDDQGVRLIYSGNVHKGVLDFKKESKNDKKKSFIKREGITEKAILVNRGYGVENIILIFV